MAVSSHLWCGREVPPLPAGGAEPLVGALAVGTTYRPAWLPTPALSWQALGGTGYGIGVPAFLSYSVLPGKCQEGQLSSVTSSYNLSVQSYRAER